MRILTMLGAGAILSMLALTSAPAIAGSYVTNGSGTTASPAAPPRPPFQVPWQIGVFQ